MALPKINKTGPCNDIDLDGLWGGNFFLRELDGSIYYFGVFARNERRGDLEYLFGPNGETLALLSAKETRYRFEDDDVVLFFPRHPGQEYVISPRDKHPTRNVTRHR